jgi:hypothetical protein
MAVSSLSGAEYWTTVEPGRLQKTLFRGGKIFQSGGKIYFLALQNCWLVRHRIRLSVQIDYSYRYAIE